MTGRMIYTASDYVGSEGWFINMDLGVSPADVIHNHLRFCFLEFGYCFSNHFVMCFARQFNYQSLTSLTILFLFTASARSVECGKSIDREKEGFCGKVIAETKVTVWFSELGCLKVNL